MVDELRTAVRAWLAERFEERDPALDDDRLDIISRTPDGHDALVSRARALQGDLARAGFAAVDLPEEYGGRGLSRAHAAAVADQLNAFASPSLRPLAIGLSLAAPTILAFGTEEQKRRFLPPLVSGRELWCQLFSEPDAGSDLVALRCQAVLDGDSWIVDGQKVWSSYASDAQLGMLLVRSDPSAAKPHAGITMLVLKMDAPGVVIRPLVDIAGGRHFNEVFLDGVVVPAGDVLGAVHGGWQVANGTLGGERGKYRGGSGDGRRRRQVLDAATRAGVGVRADPLWRQRMVSVIADELILDWLGERIGAGAVSGGSPAAGSLMKTAAGTLEQAAAELVSALEASGGMGGLAWRADDRDGDAAAHALCASRQATIAGGTHQIQRNLIGERLLGLPR